MSVMTENTLAGSGGLRRYCSSAPDKLGYEPVIRSGHYLVRLTESNRRHPAYKAGALPAELNQQSGSGLLRGGCRRVVQHVSTQEP